MNNRNSMLYGLYTIGAKYVYMWYKERSSEEYNEWFEKFDFPKQFDILSELYPIWLDVVYKNFVKKTDDLILYNLYINGLDFIKNTNIKKSDFKKWFFEVVTKMPDEDLRLLQNDYYNNITKILCI